MTSCHNHEANQIDAIAEEVFVKKSMQCYTEIMSSIIPVRQLEVRGYEENQLKLTGLVETSEFAEGFRSIYMKTLVYFVNKLLSKQDE